MPTTFQERLARSTEKAAKNLMDVAQSLSEEKRTWKPLDKGRSAIDQVAECALINQYSIEILKTFKWPAQTMEEFFQTKEGLAATWETARTALDKSMIELLPAIRDIKEDQLETSIASPFGPMTLEEIAAYSQWNMTYHEGQINYIKSLAEGE